MNCNLQTVTRRRHDVPRNTDGENVAQVYKNQNFERVVKPWLFKDQDPVRKEDGDSEHGKIQNQYRASMVRRK